MPTVNERTSELAASRGLHMSEQRQPIRALNDYKIVLVSAAIPPVFSGAGHRFYKYAQRLERRAQLAFLLCLAFEEESYQDFQPELDEKHIVRMPPEGMPHVSVSSLWTFALKLWRLLLLFLRVGWLLLRQRSQYDIVHVVSESWVCAFALFWARIFGRVAIYESSLVGQDDLPSIMQTAGRVKVKYWLLTRAHAYVAISPRLYDLFRTAAIREDRLYLIGNGVQTDVFCPIDECSKLKLRKRLGLPENGPTILFVGGIIERKGADLLPEIFRRVLRAFPGATLLLVGKEQWSAQSEGVGTLIRRELHDYIATGQVIMAGTVSNVHEYMQASDVFLLPSRREGFGTVLAEAMACGLPVVVRSLEGITSFILKEGVHGISVSGDDTAAYADGIIRLLLNHAEYIAMSRQARTHILSSFSDNVIDEQYRLAYQGLLVTAAKRSSKRRV